MRAAQMAEEEFDGRPLVPVIRLRAGEYKSRDGLILFRLVKFKKISSNYWEAVDAQTGAVLLTEKSLVKLRFSLAERHHDGNPCEGEQP